MLSIIPISFLTANNKAILTPPANTVSQSMFLNHSTSFEPKSEIVFQTLLAPSFIPLFKPSTVFLPTSYISLDGECIPRTSLIAASNFDPISIRICGIDVNPSLSPFLKPSITLLPISVKSMFLMFSINSCTFGIPLIVLYNSLNASAAILTPSPSNSKPLVIKSLLNKKSLNLTIASPILAVKSKISISKALKMADNALNAIFIPPPAIVVTISRMANKPLNVRFSLSTSSFVSFMVIVNL